MDSDQAARLAKGLAKNRLLPELLDARANEIRDEWEAASTPEKREQHWQQLKATTDLRDYLYARIDELTKREPTE